MASAENKVLLPSPEGVAPAAENAARVAADAPPALGGKKMLRMGSWAVKDESELKPAYFSFRNISCVLPVKGVDKQLLLNASGYCKPGETLAIMGPSGAGKSTLLDILSYRKTTGRFTQDVMLNGERLSQRTFIKHNGYVTSDDLLPPELTVREALEFCAALRLPAEWTAEQRNARIEDVLSVLRLNYVEHNKIGSALVRGLSTGERKRVNVAVELLPVAAVVFLDEPTTGLDSNTGREIIENVIEVVKMRKLACVATIHQPSYTILRQFDNLLLLANGRMCFFGRTPDCIGYFENYLGIPVHGNPAEIYAEAQAASPDRLIEAWDKSAENGILEKAITAIHTGQGSITNYKPIGTDEVPTFWDNMGFYQQAPGFTQLKQLLVRQSRIYFRNSIMSTSRLIAALITALFFGFAYLRLERNQAGSAGKISELFALKLMTPGYGSAAIAYWLEKRKQYYHEEAAGYYHRFYYILSNFIVEWLFLSVAMSLCFLVCMSLSGWIAAFFGHYILYFVIESWAVTGWNLVCAYMAASIPYANAAFTVHYFWALLVAGWYLTNSFLYNRPGGNLFKYFLIWTSYARPVFMSCMRNEFWEQEIRCEEDEKFPFDLTGLTSGGLSGGSLAITKAAISNTSIINTINTFGKWQNATDAQNATVKEVFNRAVALSNAVKSSNLLANATAAPAALSALVSSELNRTLAAFTEYTGVAGTTVAAVQSSLSKLMTANAMVYYADYLKAPNNYVQPLRACFAPDGASFLGGNGGQEIFKTVTLDNGTSVQVKGFDHPDVTPNWIYQIDNVAQGILMFTIAYFLLRYCNFRQK